MSLQCVFTFFAGFVAGFVVALVMILGIVIVPVIVALFLLGGLLAYISYRKRLNKPPERVQ